MTRWIIDESRGSPTPNVTVNVVDNHFVVRFDHSEDLFVSRLTCDFYVSEIMQYLSQNYTRIKTTKLEKIITPGNLCDLLRLSTFFTQTRSKKKVFAYVNLPIMPSKKHMGTLSVQKPNESSEAPPSERKPIVVLKCIWYFEKVQPSGVEMSTTRNILLKNHRVLCSLLFCTGNLRTHGLRRKMIYTMLPFFWK